MKVNRFSLCSWWQCKKHSYHVTRGEKPRCVGEKMEKKKVTVEEWESGKIKLPDDFYEPIETFHPFLGPRVVGFKGRATGIILESGFADILEKD